MPPGYPPDMNLYEYWGPETFPLPEMGFLDQFAGKWFLVTNAGTISNTYSGPQKGSKKAPGGGTISNT